MNIVGRRVPNGQWTIAKETRITGQQRIRLQKQFSICQCINGVGRESVLADRVSGIALEDLEVNRIDYVEVTEHGADIKYAPVGRLIEPECPRNRNRCLQRLSCGIHRVQLVQIGIGGKESIRFRVIDEIERTRITGIGS